MANLHKFTVQEALNASQGSAGGWTVSSRLSIGGGAAAYKLLDASTTQIGIWSDLDVCFSFSTTASNPIDTGRDLILPAQALTFITVPKNVGSPIYFHVEPTSSVATKYLRIVEV